LVKFKIRLLFVGISLLRYIIKQEVDLGDSIKNNEGTNRYGMEGYKTFSKFNQFNKYIEKTIELYKSTLDISCLTL